MSKLKTIAICATLLGALQTQASAEKTSTVKNASPAKAVSAGRCSRLVPISIPEKDFPYEAQVQGKILSGIAKIYYYDGGFSGGRNIKIDFTFKNPSSTPAFYSISIGFFDKDGDLVVSEGRYEIFGQAPGKNGHCELDMCLPPGYLPAITDYQITFYDDSKKIGN